MSITTKQPPSKSDGKKPVRKVRKTTSKSKGSRDILAEAFDGIVHAKKSVDEFAREQEWTPQKWEEMIGKGRAVGENDEECDAFIADIYHRRKEDLELERRRSRH